MTKKLYIFAVEGVLVDCKHLINQAVEEPKHQAGFETGLAQLADDNAFDLSDALSLPEDEESCTLLNRVHQIVHSRTEPMRGVVNVLQTTKHKCVVTEEKRLLAEISLRKTGFIVFFDGSQIFSLDILQPGLVPLSEFLLFVARSIEFDPAQCIFVTDEVQGVLAATTTGMQSIGFIGGSHILSAKIEQDMKQAGASQVIINMSALVTIMEDAA